MIVSNVGVTMLLVLLLSLSSFKGMVKSVAALVPPTTRTTTTTNAFEPRMIRGKRCLVVEPPTLENQESSYPPLVLLGGMAQSLESWTPHLSALSRNRKVVVYECIGQGKSSSSSSDSNLDLTNVTLPYQAEQLLDVIEELVEEDGDNHNPAAAVVPSSMVDLVGFSLGGRVGMAAACLRPERFHKLYLTGVASDRSQYGRLAIRAWKDAIESDPSLRSFAWSVLLATYNSSFLCNTNIERYIDHICRTNTPEGLLALLQQAEVSDSNDHWHVTQMADRLALLVDDDSNGDDKTTTTTTRMTTIQGKLCIGEQDWMAPLESARELSLRLGWDEPTVIPECGHAVATEAPRAWRKDVLSFLNEPVTPPP